MDIADAGMVSAFDANRTVRQGRGGIFIALAIRKSCCRSDEHSDNAEEVSNRITDRRQVQLSRGLASSGQGGSVGYRPGEGARDECGVHSPHAADDLTGGCGYAVKGNHGQNWSDCALDVVEEGSAGVHTDSEGEERKAKCAQLSGDA